MNRRIIIVRRNDKIITAFAEDGEIVELRADNDSGNSLLGNIYAGRVSSIASGMNAAFIDIKPGVSCYYPLMELSNAVFITRQRENTITQGDLLLVQVSREAIKSKAPSVTTRLNFAGRYLVLITGEKRIGISSRINGDKRELLHELLEKYSTDEYGFIVRTNAAYADRDEILDEVSKLTFEYRKLRDLAETCDAYDRLRSSPPGYAVGIRDFCEDGLVQIVTDRRDIYETVRRFLAASSPKLIDKVFLYENRLMPLSDLYSIETTVTKALHKTIWMKSGAYLVIQITEALTAIDVNTGKAENRRRETDFFRRINLEAAKEAARQIRLRNLSGIILIDFINMKDEDDTNCICRALDDSLKKDPIHAEIIDITKLQLVEITRKKVRRPFEEMINMQDDTL